MWGSTETFLLQAAPSEADFATAHVYEGPIGYSIYDIGPQRRLSQALGAAPVVIPAPRMVAPVAPVARPAAVVQPVRQTSSVPGADIWYYADLHYRHQESVVRWTSYYDRQAA